MRPSRRRRTVERLARFESVEPRLFLAADLYDDICLNYFIEGQVQNEIHTALAEAHELTGLDTVREEYGFTGAGQTVAVIDTGIAYTHEALGGGIGADYRVVGGFDFSEERDLDPYDDGPYGLHGTHVAGIIGGSDPTALGVAPEVDMVALRVFNDEGDALFSWVEEALQWVHENRDTFENPITAVNLSLGTRWNSDQLPNWAMLENEFAQLEADGIFIAVAAGNSFTSYEEPGLSYPAVSQYVVPVASVDDDGSLSYFSQRAERVIAAPGRHITSTVPDYAGDRNGIDDDFGVLSGTSMATPYVAGASVLLREAYEYVGVTDVTQDMLYSVMYDTADLVYDAITGLNYHRLNLEQAVASIFEAGPPTESPPADGPPADDYGSTRAAAHDLGTVEGLISVDGTIETVGDEDWFSFVAGSDGTIQVTVDAAAGFSSQWEIVSPSQGTSNATGNLVSFEVVAGERYSLGLSSQGDTGQYHFDVALDPAPTTVVWGTVLQDTFNDYTIDGEGTWFELTAARDGLLTAEAFFDHFSGDVDLRLYDANGNLLGTSAGISNSERIDVSVSAGDQLFLRVYTYNGQTNGDVDFRMTNLVAQNGDTVQVGGTSGDDYFVFRAGTTHFVSIGGVQYRFDASSVSQVAFDGGGGSDTAELHGTTGSDHAVLRVGSGQLSGAGYLVQATNVEMFNVYDGGGIDQAELYDSLGRDTLVASPGYAQLTGDGFANKVIGFEGTRTYATAGTGDLAKLFDSAGNDTFIATSVYSVLRGSDFANEALNFRQVHAYATAGGNDVAKLFDSYRDDTFYADPIQGVLYGDGFLNRAKHFEQVHAYATAGGNDASYLIDSAGDDTYYADGVQDVLYGNGFLNRAKHFEEVHAVAENGGYDRVYLEDSAVDEVLSAAADWAHMTWANSNSWANGFDYVRANADSGGNDRAEISAVDYVLELDGTWS